MYHVECVGHDTSMRQHYKGEHCASCCTRYRHDMTEKLLKSTLKQNKQTNIKIKPEVSEQHDQCYKY